MSDDDFETLYNYWPTKGNKGPTKQAFDFCYKKFDYSGPDYIKAARLWAFKANDFQRKNQLLGNWLRDEKFVTEINEIKSAGGFDNALKNAEMFRDAAQIIVFEWNRLRRPWWAKIEDTAGRLHIIEEALHDSYFQHNWQKALKRAVGIFEYAVRDSIGKITLLPTIDWFCNIGEKTVARIIEGYYGHPEIKHEIVRGVRPNLSDEDRAALSDLIAVTKQNITSDVKQQIEGPWKVVSRISEYQLRYKGTTIKTESMGLTKADQEAQYNTLVNQANSFNNIGYEPDLNVTKGFE